MINNSNDKKLKGAVNELLSQNSEIGNELKNLINSLSPEDMKKISVLMKNGDIQKIANSIIDSKKPKE